jgi:DNA-binding HxlR family transcriptional regulator
MRRPGRSLDEPITAITDWAERNVHAVMSARGQYDGTIAPS